MAETEEPRIYDIQKEYVIRRIAELLRRRSSELVVAVWESLERNLPENEAGEKNSA